MSTVSAHEIGRQLEIEMDACPLGQMRSLGWVAMMTGLDQSTIEAYLIMGPGRGSNWRIGYRSGEKGLVRLQVVE